jgi:hypothetical protein
MNRPSYKELWLYECKDRDEQLQWIRNAVNGNAKFCNSEPPYSEEEELARKIMQMHARIAELEAAQRWIPVSERLPEVGKVVVVIDMNDTGGHLCNLYETAMLVEVSGNKKFGFIGHSGWDTSDVTHWMYAMPLPKLPEVQE